MTFECAQPTPMILMVNVHGSRTASLIRHDEIHTAPSVDVTGYRDSYGNWCSRILAPQGRIRLFTDTIIQDSGQPDIVARWAREVPVQDLPPETLVFLLASRYCETDLLGDEAWQRFGATPPGWQRVQAICDFVHNHLTFGYPFARRTRTAFESYQERTGVCRDYAHLAIALCRSMNIPARYCTGYLGDIGVDESSDPMDFAAWFEAYLDNRWHTFDARTNRPRIGRILMARGRDAADVAIATTFGHNRLERFVIRTEEVPESESCYPAAVPLSCVRPPTNRAPHLSLIAETPR